MAIYKDIMGFVPVPPAVSILLPIHQVFSSTSELRHRLKIALENVQHRLLKNFTTEIAVTVMERLESLQLQVDNTKPHKSIALFASPHKSKLVYLDTSVEERIVIGDTFAVREIVADSKQLRQYLILVLSDKECQFYLAGENKLERLKTDIPAEVVAYVNEKPERVANFTDPGDRKEIVMDKFLHQMDQELSHILASHPLPVFVLGPEKVTGHFKVHSRHLPQIAACVHGNYVDAGEPELLALMEPCLETWTSHNRETLLSLLQTAADQKRLSTGIVETWAAVWNNKGRLLVVEKGYRFPARRGESPDRIFREDFPEDNPFSIQDAVDALIGQIISRGGEAEFVDDGALREYDRIALIRYY